MEDIWRIFAESLMDLERIVEGSWEDKGSSSEDQRRSFGGSLEDPWEIIIGSLVNRGRIVGQSWKDSWGIL